MTTGAYAIREYAQATLGGGVPGIGGAQRLSWMNTRIPAMTFAVIFISEVSEAYYDPVGTIEENVILLDNWQRDVAAYELLVQQLEDAPAWLDPDETIPNRVRWPWLLFELIHVYESRPGRPDAFVVAPIVPFGAGHPAFPHIPLPTRINGPDLIMLKRKRGIETFRFALEQRGSPIEPNIMRIAQTGSMDPASLHPGLDDWLIETREDVDLRLRGNGRWVMWLSHIIEDLLEL